MANGTLKVENIQTSSGSGTITIGQSGETVSFPTGVSLTGNGISNRPSFAAFLDSNYTLASGTRTLVPFDVVQFNNDNCYDTSTYKFTAPSAGQYVFLAQVWIDDTDAGDYNQVWLYKNGSRDFSISGTKRFLGQKYTSSGNISLTTNVNAILDLEKDDYIQVYAAHNQGASQAMTDDYNFFMGYKLIG